MKFIFFQIFLKLYLFINVIIKIINYNNLNVKKKKSQIVRLNVYRLFEINFLII